MLDGIPFGWEGQFFVGGRQFGDVFKMRGKIGNEVLGFQIYLKIITRNQAMLVLKEIERF